MLGPPRSERVRITALDDTIRLERHTGLLRSRGTLVDRR
jgi:hypothetical protein